MSADAVKWARQQRTGGPAEKSVLFVLAAASDRSGACGLSTRQIAIEVDTDRATVWRILDRLSDQGLVSWTEGAGRVPNTYRLRLGARGP